MNRIAIIGANEPLEPFYQQARALGYYIVGIAWDEGAVCRQYCDKFYPISFMDKETVLRICEEEKVDGITSFSLESALPTVIYVAQHLGLVSNGYNCLELTKDKFSQRLAFENHGILVPKYERVRNSSDINLSNFRFPIIVKPIDGGGSKGITKVEFAEDFEDAFENAVSLSKSHEAIVEEFIDGREFSVEYLSSKGKHYNIQITDKVTSGSPHFIEMQHHQPAQIDESMRTEIISVCECALDALRIANSPSHIELKINSDNEIYIIEIGARMGGDYITSDLVRLSTGYDMVKGCIDLALGNFRVPKINNTYCSGVIFYSELAPNIGDIIRHHELYQQIVKYGLKEGPLLKAESNADRNGYIIYQSNKRLNF